MESAWKGPQVGSKGLVARCAATRRDRGANDAHHHRSTHAGRAARDFPAHAPVDAPGRGSPGRHGGARGRRSRRPPGARGLVRGLRSRDRPPPPGRGRPLLARAQRALRGVRARRCRPGRRPPPARRGDGAGRGLAERTGRRRRWRGPRLRRGSGGTPRPRGGRRHPGHARLPLGRGVRRAVRGGDEAGRPARAGLGPPVAARPRHRGGGRRRPRDPAAPGPLDERRSLDPQVRASRPPRSERCGDATPTACVAPADRPGPSPAAPRSCSSWPWSPASFRGLRRRRRRGQRHHHRRGRVADRAARVRRAPITATDFSFESSSQRISAGRVRLTLDNQGKEAHQVQLGLVEPGTTADSFARTFHEKGAGEAEKMLRWQTG